MAEYLRVRYPVRTRHSIWNQYRINVYFLWIKILHQIQGNFVAIFVFKAVTLRMSAVSRTSLLAAREWRAWLWLSLMTVAFWPFEARTTLRMSEFDMVIADMILGTLLNIIIPFVHPILYIKAIKLPAINCRSKKQLLGWLAAEKVCGCSFGSKLGKNIGDAVYSPRFVYG